MDNATTTLLADKLERGANDDDKNEDYIKKCLELYRRFPKIRPEHSFSFSTLLGGNETLPLYPYFAGGFLSFIHYELGV